MAIINLVPPPYMYTHTYIHNLFRTLSTVKIEPRNVRMQLLVEKDFFRARYRLGLNLKDVCEG